jgi:hypothetical protein
LQGSGCESAAHLTGSAGPSLLHLVAANVQVHICMPGRVWGFQGSGCDFAGLGDFAGPMALAQHRALPRCAPPSSRSVPTAPCTAPLGQLCSQPPRSHTRGIRAAPPTRRGGRHPLAAPRPPTGRGRAARRPQRARARRSPRRRRVSRARRPNRSRTGSREARRVTQLRPRGGQLAQAGGAAAKSGGSPLACMRTLHGHHAPASMHPHGLMQHARTVLW